MGRGGGGGLSLKGVLIQVLLDILHLLRFQKKILFHARFKFDAVSGEMLYKKKMTRRGFAFFDNILLFISVCMSGTG